MRVVQKCFLKINGAKVEFFGIPLIWKEIIRPHFFGCSGVIRFRNVKFTPTEGPLSFALRHSSALLWVPGVKFLIFCWTTSDMTKKWRLSKSFRWSPLGDIKKTLLNTAPKSPNRFSFLDFQKKSISTPFISLRKHFRKTQYFFTIF